MCDIFKDKFNHPQAYHQAQHNKVDLKDFRRQQYSDSDFQDQFNPLKKDESHFKHQFDIPTEDKEADFKEHFDHPKRYNDPDFI